MGDKPLVIQFTVKHEQNIDCGGGYVKLFDCKLDQADMHGDSPYNVMFGPDICGPGTKKVHVIFEHKGKNHLIKKDIRCKDDVFTHLYTLILNTDGSFEVLIDNEKAESGTLTDDWDFLPPKKIKDPEAKKPADWVDNAQMDDPDATKPEDWDDEMDGEWEPPMIDNPEYKGEWKPKQIDNPAYEADANLYRYSDIGVIGLDLWQVKSGTIFDNFLITDDADFAEEVGNETWGKTKDPEKKMKDTQDDEDRKKREEEEAKNKEAEKDSEGDDEDEEEEEEEEEEDDDAGHDEL